MRHKRCEFNPGIRKIPWSSKRQPTPVFLLGKFHRQKSLAGYSPRGHEESDTTEQMSHRHKKSFKSIIQTLSSVTYKKKIKINPSKQKNRNH